MTINDITKEELMLHKLSGENLEFGSVPNQDVTNVLQQLVKYDILRFSDSRSYDTHLVYDVLFPFSVEMLDNRIRAYVGNTVYIDKLSNTDMFKLSPMSKLQNRLGKK